jgi:hypothetical protein
LTVVGRIRVSRQYVSSAASGSFPADAVVGVDGYVTRGAERMAVLAGARDSFARAQTTLKELAGLELDDEAIRHLTHAAGKRLSETRSERTDAERFAAAEGVIETQIDAGKVNTLLGWRDVKMAVFCSRTLGESATPAQWSERELPAPTIRTVVANIEEVNDFAKRVRCEADRLGVTTADDVTVLGDGAEWIWNLASDVLPQAEGLLDVYHALEHISDATKAIWGEGSPASVTQRDAGRKALVASGKRGLQRWIAKAFTALPPGASGDELRTLAAYFAPHPQHLNYAPRLRDGRSIGSGLIEGSVKQLVNRRMKLTGARWRVEHVGPLVELAAIIDTPDWTGCWTIA